MKKAATRAIAAAIALILVFGLLLGMFAEVIVSTAYGVDNKTKLATLREELAKTKTTTSQIQKTIDGLSDDKSTQFERKIALEQQINSTQEEIAITEEMIVELEALIAQKQSDLDVALANEAEQYALFKSRVRAMYENDSATILELVFSAASFTEIFARLEYTQDITAYNKSVMENLAKTRAYIEDLKAGLESDKAEQENLKADLVAKEAELVRQTEEVEALIVELDEQIKNETLSLEASKKIEEDYLKQIAAVQEEIRKAEEAERKRKEEEAKKKAAEEAAKKAAAEKANESKYNGGQMKWPLPGYYKISSDYAMRDHPITGKYGQHTGIDIPAPKGTKIKAAADGTVITVGYNTAYGNRVIISHGGGIQTLYAHMSKFDCKVGDKVKAGDVIGYVGSTGYSTGNHLHFSVLKNGNYVSPWNYVSK